MSQIEYRMFSSDHLREFCERVFQALGVPEEDARQAADVLALSDLRGIDSHGVARLKSYQELIKSGRINPRPTLSIVRESPSTATVDGDNGLGLVVGPRANRIAMDKADEVGSGWVAIRNTNHFGIAGYYVLKALERDLIGWAMTNTTSIVAPHGGAERRLGTNPIAIAFPGAEEPPIVIDLATTAAAFGKIEIAIRHEKKIPHGWAIDRDGQSTDDPHEMVDGGALLPIGSSAELGAHKGYCLSAMVDLLSGVLSGANWGPFAPPAALHYPDPPRSVGKGIGHFLGAWRIDAFIDPQEFRLRVDEWIRTFRDTRAAPGNDAVLIPGDPERAAEAERRREGIPLVMPVIRDLQHIAQQCGVPFD